MIATDLIKEKELEKLNTTQKIDFIKNLKRDDGTTMLFVVGKSEETVLNFSENTVNII